MVSPVHRTLKGTVQFVSYMTVNGVSTHLHYPPLAVQAHMPPGIFGCSPWLEAELGIRRSK